MKFPERARQTGRTRRMLEDAKRLVGNGKEVIVVCRSERHCIELKKRFGYINEDQRKVRFVSIFDGNLKFDGGPYLYLGSTACVLFDHAAIEIKFSRMLDMLVKYDLEPIE